MPNRRWTTSSTQGPVEEVRMRADDDFIRRTRHFVTAVLISTAALCSLVGLVVDPLAWLLVAMVLLISGLWHLATRGWSE